MAISTNGAIITRLAGALYGEYLSNASYVEVSTTAPATVATNWLANDFSGKTDMQVATAILKNLGLTSITGLDNWLSAQLTAAGATAASKGAALVSILNGYANMTADATYGSYAVGFNAKVDASLSLSQTAGAKGGSFATADVVAITNGSFTLTTGVDNLSGGAGSDTFSGVIANSAAANTTGTTFQAGDVVTGGAGTDTLNISVSGGTAGTNAAVTMTGIERVMVNNVNGATESISMALADSNLTTVGHSASNDNSVTTFTGLNKIVGAELSNGSAGITLTYNAAVVAGSADSATLTLANQTAGTFTSDGIETLNVVSNTLANTVALGSSHTAVNVTGAANLNIGTVPASVATLNASAFTGNLTATLSNLATQVVTGGSGNDAITAGTNLSGIGAVNAGAGTDTLVTTADAVIATAADGARYTNFETLSVRTTGLVNGAQTRAQDMSLVSGITAVNVTSARVDGQAANATHGVTLSNLPATLNTLNVTGLVNADATVGTDGLDVTVTATRAINTTADAITVNLGTSTATVGTTGTATGGAAAGAVTLALSLANEESITINSLGGATGTNFLAAITDTSATSVTFTGARDLSFASLSGTATRTIDASAMTGALIMGTNASAVASTISGGAGSDTLTGGSAADNISGGAGNDSINGAAGADVISGGDGNDTINAGSGIDNLSGGAGNDTFIVTTAADFTNLVTAEVVAGGDGTDNLSFSETATAITVAATDLAGINSIERITINGTSGAGSVTVNDAVFTANGSTTLAIVDGDLTQGTLSVTASALTAANSIQVTANTATGVNDTLIGGAGADTFTFSTTAGLQSTDTVTGGAGSDTIVLSAASAAVTAALNGVTGVESVTVTGSAGDASITVGADTVIAASGTLTTNASSLVAGGSIELTYDGSAISTATKVQNVTGSAGDDTITGGAGNDIIVGGDGNDSITGGTGIDNLSGGSGNDIFVVATTGTGFTGLTTAEAVSGGVGNDSLQFAAGTLVIAAADLVNVSGIETIELQNSSQTASLTLTDAFFSANGSTTLAVTATTQTTGATTLAASTLTAANSVQLNMSKTDNSAGNVINMGAGNDTLTIDLQALNNTTTLAGGAGNDTLVISANTGSANITQDATITGWETVSFLAAGVAGTFATTTNDAGVAAGVTQTINGSNLTGTLLWNGAAELDGKFSITGGTGADSLTGGSLADTITGGAGADVITGGLGADSLTGGTGVDTFVYASVAQSNGTNTDSITDFATGSDKLQVTLDYSSLVTALDISTTRASAGVAGTSAAQDTLSGQRGQYVYDTTNSALLINFNADNMFTTADYKINLNPASTASASIVDGDINFVVTGGSAADVIVGGAGADTIDGGAGADSITAGAGADSITAGAGADTITGGAGNDTIVLGSAGDVDVVVLAASASANGVDTVTGFTTTADKLNLDALTAETATTSAAVGDNATLTVTAGKVYFLASATASDADTAAAVATLLSGAAGSAWTNGATGTVAYFVVNDNNSGSVWSYTEAGGTEIEAAELTLIATVDAKIVAADLLFA
jgi:Ca2+-binding RTX toxin-like protein